jgi:hypothetical protein
MGCRLSHAAFFCMLEAVSMLFFGFGWFGLGVLVPFFSSLKR